MYDRFKSWSVQSISCFCVDCSTKRFVLWSHSLLPNLVFVPMKWCVMYSTILQRGSQKPTCSWNPTGTSIILGRESRLRTPTWDQKWSTTRSPAEYRGKPCQANSLTEGDEEQTGIPGHLQPATGKDGVRVAEEATGESSVASKNDGWTEASGGYLQQTYEHAQNIPETGGYLCISHHLAYKTSRINELLGRWSWVFNSQVVLIYALVVEEYKSPLLLPYFEALPDFFINSG